MLYMRKIRVEGYFVEQEIAFHSIANMKNYIIQRY